MYTITVEVSNDTLANARHEIGKFIEFENNRMAGGNGGEGHGTAASGYVFIRKVARAIDGALEQRAQAEQAKTFERVLRGPTVKELRRKAS